MVKESKPKKTQTSITAQAVPEKDESVTKDYTGYFYNQIETLWKEVMVLQEQNIQLKAQIKGEY